MRTLEALKKLALKVCTDKNESDLAGMDTTDKLFKFIAQNYNQFKKDITLPVYIKDVPKDTTGESITSQILSVEFSPNGELLVVLGNDDTNAKLYRNNRGEIEYINRIPKNAAGDNFSGIVLASKFSPDGSLLVVGHSDGTVCLYSVNGENVTFLNNIYADNNQTALGRLNTIYFDFSPDGTKLAISGSFTGGAKLYSVDGTTVTYLEDLYSDSGKTTALKKGKAVSFSPDGTYLFLACTISTGYGKNILYSVDGNNITFVQMLTGGYVSNGDDVAFLPNNNAFVTVGENLGRLFTIVNGKAVYTEQIYADNDGTVLGANPERIEFSDDGTMCCIAGGGTSGYYVKFYSVEGTKFTYIGDVYADNNGTSFDSKINGVSISPDGLIVVGGYFNGKVKIYSQDTPQ